MNEKAYGEHSSAGIGLYGLSLVVVCSMCMYRNMVATKVLPPQNRTDIRIVSCARCGATIEYEVTLSCIVAETRK